MKPPMLHTAYKVTTTRNAYGDFTASGETALKCHFRYVSRQLTGISNEQATTSGGSDADAIAWFEPDSGIDREDIIKFEGEHFRVETIIKARRLRQPEVLFIKAELLRYGTIS